jgi:hypothetical protein
MNLDWIGDAFLNSSKHDGLALITAGTIHSEAARLTKYNYHANQTYFKLHNHNARLEMIVRNVQPPIHTSAVPMYHYRNMYAPRKDVDKALKFTQTPCQCRKMIHY